jgi:hypothetical protein
VTVFSCLTRTERYNNKKVNYQRSARSCEAEVRFQPRDGRDQCAEDDTSNDEHENDRQEPDHHHNPVTTSTMVIMVENRSSKHTARMSCLEPGF